MALPRSHPAPQVQTARRCVTSCCGLLERLPQGQCQKAVYFSYPQAGVKIKRHIKIHGEANPYDPAWEQYFEQRLGLKMTSELKGRRQLLHLWREQHGLCPVCNQKITTLTGWHSHHIVRRVDGGSDGLANRVLLHPNCHSQVHSQAFTVVKPRPARGV